MIAPPSPIKITPEIEAQIYALSAAGKSHRTIAKEIGGISHVAVGACLRKRAEHSRAAEAVAERLPAAPRTLAERLTEFAGELTRLELPEQSSLIWEALGALSALDVAGEDDADDVPLEGDALSIIRKHIARNQRESEVWAGLGNAQAATRAGRNVTMALPLLARLEREAKAEDGSGLCHIPRAEIAQAQIAQDRRLEMVAASPRPLCPPCGSQLRQSIAEAPDGTDTDALIVEFMRGRIYPVCRHCGEAMSREATYPALMGWG